MEQVLLPPRPSLTWPGILRIGRAPPGNRGDMKGWKRWVGSVTFISYLP